MPKAGTNNRQKAKDLIALALDEKNNVNERAQAAFTACKLIDKHELLASPLDAIGIDESSSETIRAAGSIFEALTDPTLVASVQKLASTLRRKKRQ